MKIIQFVAGVYQYPEPRTTFFPEFLSFVGKAL